MDQHGTQVVLDSLRNGPNSQLLREWENKTEEEQIAACRQLVYGATVPTLAGTHVEPNPDAVPEAIAIFESLFKKIERSTQRSASRSGSQS